MGNIWWITGGICILFFGSLYLFWLHFKKVIERGDFCDEDHWIL